MAPTAPTDTSAAPVHGATGAHAEGGHHGDSKQHEADEFPKFAAGVDAVFGFRSATAAEGSAPAYEKEALEKSVMSFVLQAEARTSKHFAIGARFPIVTSKFVDGLDGTGATTVGNLEIAPRYILELQKELEMEFEMGVALPLASGDRYATDSATVRREFANLAADRSRGFEDGALFAAHRMGFVPKLGVSYEMDHLEIGAYTKIEFLQKINGVFQPDGVDKNATATNWVTGVRAYYGVVDELLAIGVRFWGVGILEEDIHTPDSAPKAKRTQFALEPGLKSELGPARLGASYILPIGGPIHELGYKSFRITAGAEF